MSNNRKPSNEEKSTLFSQLRKVMELTDEGKRDPENVSNLLQAIIYNSKYDVIEIESLIFTRFSETTLLPVPEHNTKDCFQDDGNIKFWRDSDLDTWTPQKRKARQGGEYSADSLTESVSFREMAASILGINLETEKVRDEELQKQLIEDGHCVEMKQIDQEIKSFKPDKKDALIAKDGEITFFFVENYGGTVSVVSVDWSSDDGEWSVSIYGFGNDIHWSPGGRVVSRKYSKS